MQEECTEFPAFIGIDWADRTHDVCLAAAGVPNLSTGTVSTAGATTAGLPVRSSAGTSSAREHVR
jgi:hypothetical protein